MDESGIITDRGAAWLPTEKTNNSLRCLFGYRGGIEVILEPGKFHRFVVVFRGPGLSGDIEDTDPQHVGERPNQAVARTPEAARTADLVNQWIAKVREVLKNERPANMVLLRGLASLPEIPTMTQVQTDACRSQLTILGLARLVGMKFGTGLTLEDEVNTLKAHFKDYDYFYIHVKDTDSSGEDGNFRRKVQYRGV